ncbi:MAG TPA: autotransporter outer membrane beta-barrel domain-containing protein, partial [Rhizomicrobium sp.]
LGANGTFAVSPVAGFQPLLTTTGIVMQAATITGSFEVPDTIAGVLYPVLTKVTSGSTQQEVLTFQAASFLTQFTAGSTDQTALATLLDSLRGSSYGALLPLYQAIDPLSGSTLGQALEQLAPDAARAAPLLGDMQTTGFDSLLWQQLGATGGGAGGGETAFRINADGLKTAMGSVSGGTAETQSLMAIGQSIATNPGGGNDPIPTGMPAAPQAAGDFGAILPPGTGGFLSGSSLDGEVVIGGGGGRADVRGFIIAGGLDTPVGDGFTLGASFGYSDATATLNSAPAMLQSNALQGAIYGRYDFWGHWSAQAFASYGHQTIQTRRIVVVGLTTFAIQGHTGGDTPTAGISVGRSWGFNTLSGAPVTIVPSAGVQYTESSIDPFTETGGAPAMTFAGYSEHSILGRLGFDAKIKFHVFNIGVTPSLSAFLVENFAGNNGAISAAFAGAPSSFISFQLAQRDQAYADLGLGAAFDLSDALGTDATLSARYDATTRNDVRFGAWTGRLSIKF